MIEIRDLVKNHGTLRVLDGVTMSVRRGEVATIIGPSGGGKSTLLRCINGLEVFDAGEIAVLESNGDKLRLEAGATQTGSADSLRELRRRVGMVFQQFNLFPHLTALENCMLAPMWVKKMPKAKAEALAMQYLERVHIPDQANKYPGQLSGGQQQRVAIARTLAMHPEAILFDEPTSALDPRMAAEVIEVIADLAAAGQTMIVVTHAMHFARTVSNTVHVMHAGRVAESGPPSQIFDAPQQAVTREFLAQVKAN
jgi:ABC-type polar amino acid transport system ATPase subunit